MKIFNNIFTLVIVLAGLAGCTKGQYDQPDNQVRYSVANLSEKTRASEVSFLNEFANPSQAAFSSVGFLHAEGVNETQSFYGTGAGNGYEIISWNGSNRWEPSITYYWPKGSASYVNFVSWYDAQGTPDLATLSETSLSWTNRSIVAGDNILVADEAWRYNANASTYHIDNASVTGVPTLFHHMLTRVAFNAKPKKLTDSGTTWSVAINNFTLKNVRYVGTLSLKNADPETTSTVAWTATDGTAASWSATTATQTVSGTAVNMTTLDPVAVLPMRSFLPQALGLMAINFDYTIRTTYDANNYIEETANSGDIRLNAFTSSVSEWGMNQMITYTITIDPEANVILIDPTAQPWGVQPTQVISIE